MLTFNIDTKQIKKLNEWIAVIQKEAVEKQKKEVKSPDLAYKIQWDRGVPYVGAIGGQFVYSFCQTSLGVIVKVKDHVTGKELDLTDYDSF